MHTVQYKDSEQVNDLLITQFSSSADDCSYPHGPTFAGHLIITKQSETYVFFLLQSVFDHYTMSTNNAADSLTSSLEDSRIPNIPPAAY
jgi:hypothetical protein